MGGTLTFIQQDDERIAGTDDDRDRGEAILDYRRYANRSNVTLFASIRLLATLDEFDTGDGALCVANGWLDLKGNQLHGPLECPVHV